MSKYQILFASLLLAPAAVQAQDGGANEADRPGVFWNQIRDDYSVIVRSLGDKACAVDLIDLPKERLINLVRDADSGEYTLSLIAAQSSSDPAAGGSAALRIETTGAAGISFDFSGESQGEDGAFRTIVGPVSSEQADAILKSDRVLVKEGGAELVDMAVPSMLRVQARLKLLQCHIDRM